MPPSYADAVKSEILPIKNLSSTSLISRGKNHHDIAALTDSKA